VPKADRSAPIGTYPAMAAYIAKASYKAGSNAFFALAVMCFVGGALYHSQNNDSNEYRIPRVWHWLAEGHWTWIRITDVRMNVAGCDFEWIVAPIMLFTKHDRLLFLANWASYLLLPGLVFSSFTRLGLRPRVAWWWM
jgi:hypothetical protein